MKKILLIGPKQTKDIISSIESRSYSFNILVDKNDSVSKSLKNKVIYADFSSFENLEASIQNLKGEFDATISRYENYILIRSWVNKILDLKGPSIASSLKVTDKFLMRQEFMSFDKSITPEFAIVENAQDLSEFMKDHEYPVMLKPTNLAKSLLVIKNDNLKELNDNYKLMISTIERVYKEYGTSRKPAIIIEEFLSGSKHSIEVFMQDGKAYSINEVVDLQMGIDIGFDDNFNYSRILPSSLTKDETTNVVEVAKKGMLALDLDNSWGHCEIVYTKKGPKIIEIGARIGGYRDRMHKLANNLELNVIELDIALGNKLDLDKIHNHTNKTYCAVFELFPEIEGKFVEISNYDKLINLKSLYYHSIKKKPGDICGLSKNGFRSPIVIIIQSDNKKIFEDDYQYIYKNVKVITK